MALFRASLLLFACCGLASIRPVAAAPDTSPEDPVAIVDGVPVTRATLYQNLEAKYGAQELPDLIDAQLLANALASRGLEVSDDEVRAELARAQEQSPQVETMIDEGGPRLEYIKNQVRRNLTLRKLLMSRVSNPTPAQLQKFFATYASYYGIPLQNKIGILAVSTKARADQLVRALKANPGSFDALVKQQKQRADTDPIAGQSIATVGRFETPNEFAASRGIPAQLVAPIIKGLTTAKKGQILPMQALAPNGPYLIVKVVDHKAALRPTLAQVQTEVVTDYKMVQVATAEIKKNPANPQKLEDNLRQVRLLIEQPNPQTGQPGTRSTLRDILTYILSPASNNLLDHLRIQASVSIPDSSYRDIAKQYGKSHATTGEASANNAVDITKQRETSP